ncbi:unnamed protein product [Closterium sp. NIES-64]|nr:unnamed protein product [Closterium sp. NIES-64]
MGTHPLISSCRIKLTLLHPSLTIPPPSPVPALTTPPLSLLPSPTILPTSLPLSLTDPTPSLLPSLRPSHVTPVKTTGWTYPVLEKEQECKAAHMHRHVQATVDSHVHDGVHGMTRYEHHALQEHLLESSIYAHEEGIGGIGLEFGGREGGGEEIIVAIDSDDEEEVVVA